MNSSLILAAVGGFVVGCIVTYLRPNKSQDNNSDDVVAKLNSALHPIDNKLSNLSNLFNNSVKLGKVMERPLENWLVDTGYIKGKHFDTQVSVEIEEGDSKKSPDFVLFNAYGNKKLVIDSKLSTTNYLKLQKELDDENVKEAENYHRSFGVDIKKQIDECKKYVKMEDSLDLVVMYIGVDSIFQYLITNKFYKTKSSSEKIDLQEYAQENKVLIVNPSALYVILEHIDIVKKNFKIIEAQKELKKLHESLINSWETWSSSIDKVENSVNDVLGGIQDQKAGGVLYELKQYKNHRFKNLDSKINEMKDLLKRESDT